MLPPIRLSSFAEPSIAGRTRERVSGPARPRSSRTKFDGRARKDGAEPAAKPELGANGRGRWRERSWSRAPR